MRKQQEMVPFSYDVVSERAVKALEEIGIAVHRDSKGYTFKVPQSECHWHSDDNGRSWDIEIRGKKFWLDTNADQGFDLGGQT